VPKLGGLAAVSQDEMTPWNLMPGILKMWLPMLVIFTVQQVNQVVNTVVIGHNGDPYALAGVGLANMMQNCFCFSVIMGLSSGMDTLVSQAHGAGNNEMSGRIVQRCRAICSVNLIWIYPVLYFSSSLLALIGQDPVIAQHACNYNRASLYGLIAWVQFVVLSSFLRNRQHPALPAAVTCLCALLHPIWAVTFVHGLDLGNAGAGYALSITWWSQYILLAGYVYIKSETLGLSAWTIIGVEASALEGWLSYLEIAFPAFLQSCSEMWFWEVISPCTGLIGTRELAAQVSIVNFIMLVFMPLASLGMAGATVVGMAIGEGSRTKAANSVVAILATTVGLGGCIALLVGLGASVIAALYTPDTDVQSLATPVIRLFGLATLWKSLFVSIGAIFRGTGRTKFSSAVTSAAYWAISFPLFLFFGFVLNWGFFWMWVGICVGSLAVLPIYAHALYYMDFQVLIDERMQANAKKAVKKA